MNEKGYMQWLQIAEELKTYGNYSVPKLPKHIQIPEEKVKGALCGAYQFCLRQIGIDEKDFQYTKEIDEVRKWLQDNQHKGLLMYGDCGRGKTFLSKYVLPLVFKVSGYGVLDYYDMSYAVRHTDEVLVSCRNQVVLDDLGTEKKFNDFGTVRDTFFEVVDTAEKYGGLLILTSNLDRDELQRFYGERAFDRLLRLTHRILFTGDSFRQL